MELADDEELMDDDEEVDESEQVIVIGLDEAGQQPSGEQLAAIIQVRALGSPIIADWPNHSNVSLQGRHGQTGGVVGQAGAAQVGAGVGVDRLGAR